MAHHKSSFYKKNYSEFHHKSSSYKKKLFRISNLFLSHVTVITDPQNFE